MAEPTPSIGRQVHFHEDLGNSEGDKPKTITRPATILAVDGETVDLNVMYPGALIFVAGATKGNPGESGTWSWPPRV